MDESICEILEMLDFINAHGGFPDYNDYSDLHDAVSLLPCNAWISVDDALPPDGQLVIGAVYTTDIIRMEDGETLEDALKRTDREAAKHPRVKPCFIGSDGWYDYEGFPMVCHPRYWMAMQMPPVVEVQ